MLSTPLAREVTAMVAVTGEVTAKATSKKTKSHCGHGAQLQIHRKLSGDYCDPLGMF